MQVVNDVPAMMMHQDERTKIFLNWIITIDAVRIHFGKQHEFHMIYHH